MDPITGLFLQPKRQPKFANPIGVSIAVAGFSYCEFMHFDLSLANRFPRCAKYNVDWVVAGLSGAANPLWLTEWLTEAIDLRPGMRVLDLGCGRAVSSIFLRREFDVQVWAADLWFSASENQRRINDAGVRDGLFPVHCDARSLPFAKEFFDAVISIDSFSYYGTDDLYLNDLARFIKPGGAIAFAGAGLMQEISSAVPEHLAQWWTPDNWCLHSHQWWRRHWERTAIVDVSRSDAMTDGWRVWLDWHKVIAPENHVEIAAIEEDKGAYIGYVRLAATRRHDCDLTEPLISISTEYVPQPMLRVPDGSARA